MTRIFEIESGAYADVEMRLNHFLEDGEMSADFSADYIRSRLNGRETAAWGTTEIPMLAVENLDAALAKLRAWDCYSSPADEGLDVDMIVDDERGNRWLTIKDWRYSQLDDDPVYGPDLTDAIDPDDLEDMDSDLEDALDDVGADPLDVMNALLDRGKFEREFCQDPADLDPAELWKGFGI